MSETVQYWGQSTRDRWFFLALAAAAVAFAVVVSRFLFIVSVATVTVLVAWPLYQRVLRRVRGRRAVAAVVTTMALFAAVFGPIAVVFAIFVRQASLVAQRSMAWVQDGGLTVELETLRGTTVPWLETRVGDLSGGGLDLDLATIVGPLQSMLLTSLQAAGGGLPALLQRLAGLSIDAFLFPFVVVTLFMEGPSVVVVLKNLSPMDDDYDDRLMAVFSQFATNLVVGTFATAAVQGVVATLGYAIAGVDLAVFLGICTGLGALVPIVGPAVVWIPTTVYVGATQGWQWAVFVALWSIVVTGSIDNVVKPFFLRGDSNIHPLLIFFGVFGGLAWLGIPGAFLGPVVVALFVALYTIYVRDFLGAPPVEVTD